MLYIQSQPAKESGSDSSTHLSCQVINIGRFLSNVEVFFSLSYNHETTRGDEVPQSISFVGCDATYNGL